MTGKMPVLLWRLNPSVVVPYVPEYLLTGAKILALALIYE